MNSLSYCFLVCVLTIVPALATDGLPRYATLCGPEMAISKVHSAGISGCDANVERCQLRSDSSASVTIDFTPPLESQSLQKYVINGPLASRLPYEEKIPCSGAGITCPLLAGKRAHYTETIELAKIPKGAQRVEYILLNENLDELACINFELLLE